MNSKIIVIILIFQFLLSCKNNPIEIHEGYNNTRDGRKIHLLHFDTKKNLYGFYMKIRSEYCTRINQKNYETHSAEFICINQGWYKDTI